MKSQGIKDMPPSDKRRTKRGFRDGEEGSGTATNQEEQNQESEESVDGKDRNVWTKRLVWNT